MNRLVVIVDGFNLYHSVKDIERDLGLCYKWLDIYSLCNSFRHLVIPDAHIEQVYYFTALATHLGDITTVDRHKSYITCLENTGVIVEYGRFKPKQIKCPSCNSTFTKHEEKETDVRIATMIYHLLSNDMCEAILLITGDTDLAPSVEKAKSCFPGKEIRFAFPYRRTNDELRKIAPGSFKIRKKSYATHQFPDPFSLSSGILINKPSTW